MEKIQYVLKMNLYEQYFFKICNGDMGVAKQEKGDKILCMKVAK